MANLIIGSNGRFARAFSQVLSSFGEVKSISFLDFKGKGLESIEKGFLQNCENVIWTLGPGTSRAAERSEEIQTLEQFQVELKNLGAALPHFVYLSSGGAMYGNNPGVVNERAAILPVGIHGQKKYLCEKYIEDNFLSFFSRVSVLRVANAYALDSFDGQYGLIDSLFASIKGGKPVSINVDLNSSRQYGSHKNYAEFIFGNFIRNGEESEGLRVSNVASSQILTVGEVISIFQEFYRDRIKFEVMGGAIDSVVLKSEFKPAFEFRWTSLRESLRTVSMA